MILVTGGAGFIGSNFVINGIKSGLEILNLDKLTYAGNLNNLSVLTNHPNHHFIQGDIGNRHLIKELLNDNKPIAVIHFAAETHVDRSIHQPQHFLKTNVVDSFALLEETYLYWKQLTGFRRNQFIFLNVSTDEVYGSLAPQESASTENKAFAPNSPYAASKASFDHFVRAFHKTYQFPAISTYSSNNFGPYQFPEKLIPLMIVNALQGKPLPIYGDGQQIRQWIFVQDHCEALNLILKNGTPGNTYNVSSGFECTNIWLIKKLCQYLDELLPNSTHAPHQSLIKHVEDRPGHDLRYSIDASKLSNELGWKPLNSFEHNLKNTLKWYLENQSWLEKVMDGKYREWILTQYEVE